MKKLFSIIALAFLSTSCFSQSDSTKQIKTDTSYYITKMVDDMTDKVYYYSRLRLVLANDEKTKGFNMELNMDGKSGNGISITGISVKMVNIGSCCENNTLIIMFEGGDKISLKSWNKFNCEGNAYFSLSKKDIELLSNKRIAKVRVENGRTYDSFTKDVPEEKQDYFVQVIRAVNDNRIKKE